MKRKEISEDQLNQIVKLRQAGTPFLKIQEQTKINRQIAKRAYEKWEHSKSMQELKEARKEVAASALHDHIESLVILAASLATNLNLPGSLDDMEMNAKQTFSWLMDQDLLQRDILERRVEVFTLGKTQRFYVGDPQSYRLEKELLFESLKIHTREQVQWREVWDKWEKARDSCAQIVPKLRKETEEVIKNYIMGERSIYFLEDIKKASRIEDPMKQMKESVLKEIWRAIIQNKLSEEFLPFQTIVGNIGRPEDIDIKVQSEDETAFTFIGISHKDLADKVARISNLTANNLQKRETVRKLRDEAGKIKEVSDELRLKLNVVKLRPVIIRTRCDLCPA